MKELILLSELLMDIEYFNMCSTTAQYDHRDFFEKISLTGHMIKQAIPSVLVVRKKNKFSYSRQPVCMESRRRSTLLNTQLILAVKLAFRPSYYSSLSFAVRFGSNVVDNKLDKAVSRDCLCSADFNCCQIVLQIYNIVYCCVIMLRHK